MASKRASLLISVGAAIALAVPLMSRATTADPAMESLKLRTATVKQEANRLLVTVRMRRGVALHTLSALPPAPGKPARYVCFSFIRGEGSTRICPSRADGRLYAGRTAIGSNRKVFARSELPGARVKKRGRVIKLSLSIRRTHLEYRRLHWRVISNWEREGEPCEECADRLPDRGNRTIKLIEPYAIGCRFRGPTPVRNGPRSRRRVALTFDDGPGPYTAQVQSILERHGAKGTFFVLGDEAGGDRSRLRSLIHAGHEIGNHSSHHLLYPSRSDLAETSRAIHSATGFDPCVYRPPYGALNSGSVAAASSLGMATIIWDVDPQDWAGPGSGVIAGRVLGSTQSGSIVLMHDGGGNRSQTVAALPSIVRGLRHRGYRLVTVSKLLGYRTIFGP